MVVLAPMGSPSADTVYQLQAKELGKMGQMTVYNRCCRWKRTDRRVRTAAKASLAAAPSPWLVLAIGTGRVAS